MASQAYAGAFAVREQSAYGQGASFAGIAAGGDLSAMFWNPAVMTQFGGVSGTVVATGLFSYSKNRPDPTNLLFILGGTGNIAEPQLVPAGYFSYQLAPDFWFGVSLNAPFSLAVNFPLRWAGAIYAADKSHLQTYNATPSIAYRINDWISVGLGLQIQYADARLSRSPIPGTVVTRLEGDGWGYGFTAGATLTPTPKTTIGIGYRSGVNQMLEGRQVITGVGTAPTDVTLKLPDVVSVGIRQAVDQQLTLLGTVEWSNWSRLGSPAANGGIVPTTLPFSFDDGWFFSIGAEYRWSEALTLRAGVGYEMSPVSDRVRIPLLPDNDRIWLSAGTSWKISRSLTADLGYSHVFIKDTPINVTPANPWFDPLIPVPYTGTVKSHVDILSVGLSYRIN